MPKEKKFFVFNDLQELATESDRFAELVPQTSILDEYLSLVKETAIKIKTCTSLEDIVFPPDLKTLLVKDQRVIKNINDEITETQRAHVHAEKNGIIGNETIDIKAGSGKVVPSKDKGSILGASFPVSKNGELEKMSSSTASCNKINQEPPLPQIFIPKTEITNCPVKTIHENSSYLSQRLMNTPIMNTTFKLIDKTVILDSASSYNSNQKSKIEDNDLRITRSGTKQKLKSGESNGSGMLTQSGSKSKSQSGYESNQDNDLRITRSGTKQKLENGESNGSRKLSRSGSKRKSSQSKYESNKKQKREVNGSVSKSATKTAKSKQPRVKKNLLKPASLVASENKAKLAPVIVPTMKHNTSLVSKETKERLIMEEIQKKEEKANENLKRVLAERQLKADENKKKRNEKMEKTLLRRLHMEKEKEERLEKKESECKKLQANALKENIKQPVSKVKTKEPIDLTQGESSGTSSALKQKDTNGTVVFKTPVRKLSSCDSQTYDLTPPPDSSTYDFSDEEEEKPSGKLIPSWAQGVHLKLALTHQFYNPVKTEEIFGSVIQAPNLIEIFRIQKKEYSKRTSSAVWNSPPGNSFC